MAAIMELLTIYVTSYFRLLSNMVTLLILLCILLILLCIIVVYLLKLQIKQQSQRVLPHLRETNDKGERPLVVGFFHPYCNAGGGGERVLWVAIRAIQKCYPNIKCLVYTGDQGVTGQQILDKAQQNFNIVLSKPVEFVFLKRRGWVEAKKYPIFTLLGQSFGSLILGLEALESYVPDVFIDSMGYAFTLPLFKYFGGCKVGCYVHYPTISTDMLQRVSERRATFNNASLVSRSIFLTGVKILYYRLFAYLYGLAGNYSDVIMVNSTWTYGHIKYLWGSGERTMIVYPPCDISEFVKLPNATDRALNILSIAQFRPEKNHALQLRSFKRFLDGIPPVRQTLYKLTLVGGCRDENDRQRVEGLKNLAEELDIIQFVEFKLNVTFSMLKDLMASSTIGLHSMLDEHFGIGVVELMAAGTVVLAHNSGGPKLDIVTPLDGKTTGYLAGDEESYADAMTQIFSLPAKQRQEICESARKSVERFSEPDFERGFLAASEPILGRILN